MSGGIGQGRGWADCVRRHRARLPVSLLGLDFGREFVPRPTYFLCFAKESRQRKATPGRAPVRRLRRRWCPVLLASPGRPGMARRLRRRLAGPDCSRAGCDARRALRGGKAAKRDGSGIEKLCVFVVFGRKKPNLPLSIMSLLHGSPALPPPAPPPPAVPHRVSPAQAGIQTHP